MFLGFVILHKIKLVRIWLIGGAAIRSNFACKTFFSPILCTILTTNKYLIESQCSDLFVILLNHENYILEKMSIVEQWIRGMRHRLRKRFYVCNFLYNITSIECTATKNGNWGRPPTQNTIFWDNCFYL